MGDAEVTEAWRAKFVEYYAANAPEKIGLVTETMMSKWFGRYEVGAGSGQGPRAHRQPHQRICAALARSSRLMVHAVPGRSCTPT
jgi:hypothetical protein